MCRFQHISNSGPRNVQLDPWDDYWRCSSKSQQRSTRSLLRHRRVLAGIVGHLRPPQECFSQAVPRRVSSKILILARASPKGDSISSNAKVRKGKPPHLETTLGSKGQVTVPKAVRDRLQINRATGSSSCCSPTV